MPQNLVNFLSALFVLDSVLFLILFCFSLILDLN